MTWNEFDSFMDKHMTELYVKSGLLEYQLKKLTEKGVINFRTSRKNICSLLLSKCNVNYSEDQVDDAMEQILLGTEEETEDDLCYSM